VGALVSQPPHVAESGQVEVPAQQEIELLDQRGVHLDGIRGGVCGDRIRGHAPVDESRHSHLAAAASHGVAQPKLAPLVGSFRTRDHGTSTHIGGYALAVEATSSNADRLAFLPVPDVALEAAAIARRDANPILAVVPAIRQTARRILVIAISVLAHTSRPVRTEAILTAPKRQLNLGEFHKLQSSTLLDDLKMCRGNRLV